MRELLRHHPQVPTRIPEMARTTIAFGLALCAATVLVLLRVQDERVSAAFVPMIFGIPIFISGVISLNPHRRRTWIRLACYLAFCGGVGACFRSMQMLGWWINGKPVFPVPTAIAVILSVSLLGFAAFAHIALRRNGTSKSCD